MHDLLGLELEYKIHVALIGNAVADTQGGSTARYQVLSRVHTCLIY